tara:strand:+ start:435 stop:863 length:429 start_codon:yes stop_codon:yes gene_type:complete
MEKSPFTNACVIMLFGVPATIAIATDSPQAPALDLPEITEADAWSDIPVDGDLPLFTDLSGGGDEVSIPSLRGLDNAATNAPASTPSNWATFAPNGAIGTPMGSAAGQFDIEVSKTTVAPLPSAGVLGLVGLAAVGSIRRRR